MSEASSKNSSALEQLSELSFSTHSCVSGCLVSPSQFAHNHMPCRFFFAATVKEKIAQCLSSNDMNFGLCACVQFLGCVRLSTRALPGSSVAHIVQNDLGALAAPRITAILRVTDTPVDILKKTAPTRRIQCISPQGISAQKTNRA